MEMCIKGSYFVKRGVHAIKVLIRLIKILPFRGFCFYPEIILIK